jgi:hypothetical protein
MDTIREPGSFGPYGELVKPTDAAQVLDDMCDVLRR